MTSLVLLAGWLSVPAFMAGAASLRRRHELRFPDCPVCAQQRPSEPQNRPSRSLPAPR